MSEQQPEAEAVETEAQDEQQAEEQQPESRQERRDGHVRERLREVEAERDQLRQRLDARDKAQVEALAVAVLGDAGAKLFTVPDLATVRDDDGNLDADYVAELLAPVKAALEEGRTIHHGDMGARKQSAGAPRVTWDQLLQRR